MIALPDFFEDNLPSSFCQVKDVVVIKGTPHWNVAVSILLSVQVHGQWNGQLIIGGELQPDGWMD